nr:MAG TPA: hypothetical protein [Caudoviricetes sp.]
MGVGVKLVPHGASLPLRPVYLFKESQEATNA